MIHEHKFAPISVRLFQGRKFSRLGTERFVKFGPWFLVLGAWGFGDSRMNEQGTNKRPESTTANKQGKTNNEGRLHISTTDKKSFMFHGAWFFAE